MKSASFSFRRRTNVFQKLLAAYEERVLDFHRHSLKLCGTRQFLLGHLDNANQTPIHMTSKQYDMSMKGARDVNLLTMGNGKLRFPVMLSCLTDGTKLRPYILFNWATTPRERALFIGIVAQVNANGFMTDDMVVEWYRLVWLLRPWASLKKDIPNLLVLLIPRPPHRQGESSDLEGLIYLWGLTSQNHYLIMRDAVVEGSGNFDHLGFFNVHPNLSTRAYNISASIVNAAATAGI
ncbi:hypothetical protein HPB51_019174 [Rhipicephalus microplus]|uniref:Uncharacterized protein n=1 Tax=Rhipicephalus microplus TaxID=6941 RepID=A0A9J6DB57_RHIMP|nr:hypothetical protein HPB51_019174 [Rhipicephalus microplus]